ncbi:MAG: hypothetical protein EXX96DRAFT_478505 [Benjaminiella poitrasii]|nr:MAG: hypothetical protein EXX96DRAFT_478505 [Benjaminiella poitrasii]
MKSACEFLKDDPLSLHDTVSSPENFRTRSISFGSANKPNSAPPHINLTSSSSRYTNLHHRKSQSADLYNNNSRRNSAILRPHIVLPNPRHNENRKSLDIPNDWLLPDNVNNNINSSTSYNRYKAPTRHLIFSRPMITTTFPSISTTDIPKLGRSLSASTVVRKRLSQQPPRVINIRDRISFDGIQRPASICLDTRSLHSIEDSKEDSEELMGDFLIGLSKLDGDVVGGRTGSFKTYRGL